MCLLGCTLINHILIIVMVHSTRRFEEEGDQPHLIGPRQNQSQRLDTLVKYVAKLAESQTRTGFSFVRTHKLPVLVRQMLQRLPQAGAAAQRTSSPLKRDMYASFVENLVGNLIPTGFSSVPKEPTIMPTMAKCNKVVAGR